MRRLSMIVVAALMALAVLAGPTPVAASPGGGAVPVQLGGSDDDVDRPTNVGGLVVGIGMVVAWGVVLAEVLRRAARRRAETDAGVLDDGLHADDAGSRRPSP